MRSSMSREASADFPPFMAAKVAVLLLNGRTSGGHGDLVAYEAMRTLYCPA